jgi:LPXTG-site transpeptidase (sortase) family protein
VKKALSTVVVVALAALAAGCGGDTVASPSAATAEPTVSASAPTAAPVERVVTRSGLLSDLEVPTVEPPVALRIPELGINAWTIPVGVDSQDRYDVPSADTIGWYKFGPAPGAEGSSVLAAHVAYNGVRGVFADLGSLKPGATVEVDSAEGTTTFRVVDVVSVAKADLAGIGAFDRDGKSLLRLVTCGGEFDEQNREYSDNVVVTAEPVV